MLIKSTITAIAFLVLGTSAQDLTWLGKDGLAIEIEDEKLTF